MSQAASTKPGPSYEDVETVFVEHGWGCRDCKYYHEWREAHGEQLCECLVLEGNHPPYMCPRLDVLQKPDELAIVIKAVLE